MKQKKVVTLGETSYLKVVKQCPDPTHTTSYFFTRGNLCHCFTSTDLEVKQHLHGVDTTLQLWKQDACP